MDETGIIIAVIGGASGLISAIATTIFKTLEYRKQRKGETLEVKLDERLKPLIESNKLLKQSNDDLRAELKEIRLDTTRLQLLDVIHNEPKNVDTILKVAEFYFCHLKGDWYCTSLFRKWAKDNDVEIPEEIHSATQHYN